jgi:hypothetical protein
MRIIKATKKYSSEISIRMLKELAHPNERFPEQMIKAFREHASKSSIEKELENDKLIAFIALDEEISSKDLLSGLIVGYDEKDSAMIHYIAGNDITIKDSLLEAFINECKVKKITKIVTDTFEFMDNNKFFKQNGFKLVKEESLAKGLVALWYELGL